VATEDFVKQLDELASALARRASVRFTVATTDADRDAAFRLRAQAVTERGWGDGSSDVDEFDRHATHLVGWSDDEPVCCGRLVWPGGQLPTEAACGIVVEPAGRVVDVGRMVVAPAARDRRSEVFRALLAVLYLETRRQGYSVGCGLMAPNVRAVLRLMGVPLEVLGPSFWHRGALRAPVRFSVGREGAELLARWA
jgi:N-acyl-L-homoserine lactone synthetase